MDSKTLAKLLLIDASRSANVNLTNTAYQRLNSHLADLIEDLACALCTALADDTTLPTKQPKSQPDPAANNPSPPEPKTNQ